MNSSSSFAGKYTFLVSDPPTSRNYCTHRPMIKVLGSAYRPFAKIVNTSLRSCVCAGPITSINYPIWTTSTVVIVITVRSPQKRPEADVPHSEPTRRQRSASGSRRLSRPRVALISRFKVEICAKSTRRKKFCTTCVCAHAVCT